MKFSATRGDKINPEIRNLSDEELNAIFLKFKRIKLKGSYTMENKSGIRYVNVNEMKPHPENEKIYGNESVDDLVDQIQAFGGIADPLKIKEDNTIISRHRRWKVARKLGMTEVPCEIVSYDTEEEELAALGMFNYHRAKTNEQKAREGMLLPISSAFSDMLPLLSKSALEEILTGAADKLRTEGKNGDADFIISLMNKSVKPASDLLDAKYGSSPDEERERVRNGEVSIRQFISEHNPSEPESKASFKKIMKGLGTSNKALSDAANAVGSFSEDETAELLKMFDEIKAALAEVEAKLKTD